MKPLVSVLLPISGNDYKKIRISIESILCQTLKNIELICVIDEPNDKYLQQIVFDYKSSSLIKVIVLVNERKLGIAESLNRAAEFSNSDYIARMDSDDQSFPDRLELQHEFMRDRLDIALVGMQAVEVDSEDIEIGITNKPLEHAEISRFSRYACPLIHPTWFMRKNVFYEIGGYLNISPAQDYHLISKLLRADFKLANLSVPGLYYTLSDQSLSRKNIYTTIAVTNYIRSSIASGDNFDSLIIATIKTNKKSKYFELLYKMRSFGLLKYKSRSGLNRTIGIFITILPSMLHFALLRDTYALINIQLLRWRGQ